MLFRAGSGLSGGNENAERRRECDRYSHRYKSAKATMPTAKSSLGFGTLPIPGWTTLFDQFDCSAMLNTLKQKKLRWLKSGKGPVA
jgi:hypothetical protein